MSGSAAVSPSAVAVAQPQRGHALARTPTNPRTTMAFLTCNRGPSLGNAVALCLRKITNFGS
jgi:hypothetical protein